MRRDDRLETLISCRAAGVGDVSKSSVSSQHHPACSRLIRGHRSTDCVERYRLFIQVVRGYCAGSSGAAKRLAHEYIVSAIEGETEWSLAVRGKCYGTDGYRIFHAVDRDLV